MNVVNWFEIPVLDMQRAKAFYGRVFDCELVTLNAAPDEEMCAFPWQPGAPNSAGALVRGDRYTPSREGTRVYFQCDDVTVQQARVPEAGGHLVVPKMSIGEWGFIAMVQDTEGNIIGLHSEK